MSHVRSKDGTVIAYERSGNGPALILVDGALCSRAFGPSPKLAPLLARHSTVYAYDRRGRGQSDDTQPYAPAREVEDIAALVEAAGGSASLLGLSSGGASWPDRTHNVKPEVLTPAVVEFFTAPTATTSSRILTNRTSRSRPGAQETRLK